MTTPRGLRYDLNTVHSNLSKLIEEIHCDNDRAAIIIGAAVVDYCLQVLILQNIPSLSRDDTDRLFTDNGILGSFSAKILWAYTTKLIGPKSRGDLDIVRRIRNDAAHEPGPVSFDANPIKDRCLSIKFGIDISYLEKPLEPPARHRFVSAVSMFLIAILGAVAIKVGVPMEGQEPWFVSACEQLKT